MLLVRDHNGITICWVGPRGTLRQPTAPDGTGREGHPLPYSPLREFMAELQREGVSTVDPANPAEVEPFREAVRREARRLAFEFGLGSDTLSFATTRVAKPASTSNGVGLRSDLGAYARSAISPPCRLAALVPDAQRLGSERVGPPSSSGTGSSGVDTSSSILPMRRAASRRRLELTCPYSSNVV